MPTYEFECAKCGDKFEEFLGISDPQPKKCRHCGGKLQKVFFPVGIVFKGSGFYVTDSRKGNGKAASATTAPPKTEDTKSSVPEPPAAAKTESTATK